MTTDAVRDRTKTVTRRQIATWSQLRPGDRLTLVEKAQGVPKGQKQVVLAEVEIVAVRIEPIQGVWVESGACAAEGLPGMSPFDFTRFWLKSHGYDSDVNPLCRRIEWRYL